MDASRMTAGRWCTSRLARAAAASAILATAALMGCGGTPGGDGPDSAAKDERVSKQLTDKPVTLKVLDTGVDPGPAATYKALIEAFERAHPNVTVKRSAIPFASLLSTVKLRLSSKQAPDIAEGNPGVPVDGALIRGGLIRPLSAYTDLYGWDELWDRATARSNSFSANGKTFGAGDMWGISPRAELLGVYYNKAKLAKLGVQPPTTFAEFEQALQTAEGAGEPPIMMGDLDKYPGGHALMILATHYGDPKALSDWVYGTPGSTLDTAEMRQAAAKLQQWAKAGYFAEGFLGIKDADAQARFTRGEGVFMLTGSFVNATLDAKMKDNLGFFLLPPDREGDPVHTVGALAPAMHISTKSANPDVAAAWLNHIVSEEGAKVILDAGDLPARPLTEANVPPKRSLASIVTLWREGSTEGRFVPYFDWATTTMYDTLANGVQDLVSGRESPKGLIGKMQADWDRAYGADG